MCEIITTAKGWKNMLLDIKGWIAAILVFSICFSYYKGLKVPLTVLNTSTDTNVTFAGNYYKLCRTVKYSRDTALTIDRAFIKNTDNGDIYTISLAPLTIKRSAGTYNICRYILIPENIEPGNWTIKTYATYTYVIWQHTVEIEDIPIEIQR